jgi:hypothetical protein
MALNRWWCKVCRQVQNQQLAEVCEAVGHSLRRVGAETRVEIVVTDRRLELDVNKVGYDNYVGRANGLSSVEHERVTRQRIEEMRKEDQAAKRERRINGKFRDNPHRVGAIPSALLFSLKRQYGNDFVQKAREVMKRENLYWGDN